MVIFMIITLEDMARNAAASKGVLNEFDNTVKYYISLGETKSVALLSCIFIFSLDRNYL